jgi:hypothetical protein
MNLGRKIVCLIVCPPMFWVLLGIIRDIKNHNPDPTAWIGPLVLIPCYLFIMWIGFAVSDLCHVAKVETTANVQKYLDDRKRAYDNLPDIGKARVDLKNARAQKYGGVAVGGILAAVLLAINPGTWGGLYFIGRGVVQNWKDQDERIQDAKKRQAVRS